MTRLKVGSDWDTRILTGNEFQTLGVETEKHEIQILCCDGGLKADENWMSADVVVVHLLQYL